jgi:hypothetical protein
MILIPESFALRFGGSGELPYSNPRDRTTSPQHAIDNLYFDLFEHLEVMKLYGQPSWQDQH